MAFTVEQILKDYPSGINILKKLDGYGSENFLIEDQHSTKYILKYNPDLSQIGLATTENNVLLALEQSKTNIKLPVPKSFDGKFIKHHDQGFSRVLSYLEGEFLGDKDWNDDLLNSLGEKTATLIQKAKEIQITIPPNINNQWDLRYALLNKNQISTIKNNSDRNIVKYQLDQFEHFTLPQFESCRMQIIHGDINEWNVVCVENEVKGFIDFGDMSYGPLIGEIAIPMAYIMMATVDPLHSATVFLKGIASSIEILPEEADLLPSLIVTRACVSVINSANYRALHKDTAYISINEQSAWNLLKKWHKWNPINLQNNFRKALNIEEIDNKETVQYTEQKRKEIFAPSLSFSYNKPIHMDKAAFQYMYDKNGNAYLDAYNNIPHIGHAHPAVSEAVSKQSRLLYTNSRYLNETPIHYAEHLLSYFPSELDTILFVNSGTEANDLAARMSSTYTNSSNRIALEMGYHGHSPMCINFSPYKYNGKGGAGPSENTLELPLPKIYKGKYQTGSEYAREAINLIQKQIDLGNNFASIIVEPISGCGGQVPLADGYLKILFDYCHTHNILTISDEVQVGFGRLGEYFWGFEMHNVIPDIVVLGKPMGNGLPIAAVVTKRKIADAFNNGMEFFASFGGNQVSIAAAAAVLNTIEQEELQNNALNVGHYLMKQVENLKNKYQSIGDVRGQGFFIGIEFEEFQGLSNTNVASIVTNQLKENHILTSTDGKRNEVLKIKGPLCFTSNNVDQFCDTLESILKTL